MNPFKLSPSDFSFLWEECQRCFYLKVARGFRRPQMPFPKIFTVIDGQMTACYSGKRTEEICPELPGGTVRFGQKWVRSRPIHLPGQDATCYIRGRFDTVVAFDDGTYGVIDFKTSSRRGEHIPLYRRQLHAYAYALENPAPGSLGLGPISRLGLLIFEPSSYEHLPDQTAHLGGAVTWVPMERDDGTFLAFLGQVVSVLAQPAPPAPSPDCPWCQYRAASRRTGL
jgi:hypothetical protein